MRIVLAGILALGIGTAAGGSAQATAGCTAGFACLWQNTNYNIGAPAAEWGNDATKGNLYATSGTRDRNDLASSAHANGKQCAATRWFEHGNQKGMWIELRSQQGSTVYYKDADLANSAGIAGNYTTNFDNMATSYQFVGCA